MKRLFKMISNIFRSNVNKAADALADQERDAELGIQDAEKSLASRERTIAELMQSNNSIERKLRDAKTAEVKWQKYLEKSVEAGEREEAEKVFDKLQEAKQQVKEYSAQVSTNNATITIQRKESKKFKQAIERGKNQLVSLKARNTTAKLNQKLSESEAFDDVSNGLDLLDDLADSVAANEDKAQAYATLAADSDRNLERTLDERYSAPKFNFDDMVAASSTSSASSDSED